MGLLLLLGALPACTGIKLGYNNGVELATWWLDGYIDFTKAQSHQVRADLRQLQLHNRQHDLPAYAQTLRQAQTLVAQDVSAEQVCALFGTVRGYINALLEDAEPPATTLVQNLAPAQITHLGVWAAETRLGDESWHEACNTQA